MDKVEAMTACEMIVRAIIRQRHSLSLSELVRLADYAEAAVRAVLCEMERGDEGYFSRDLPTDEEWFTASLVGQGKEIIERRLQDQADRLEVQLERIEWTPTRDSGERAYTLTVASRGTERTCDFTASDLEECAEGAENPDIIKSRLFNLVSPYRVRRIV